MSQAAEVTERISMGSVLLALIGGGSTLVCCALPALLVTLGAGAVLASLVELFPGLIWVSEHKVVVFGIAAMVLLMAGGLQWFVRTLPCPVDVDLAEKCSQTRRWTLSLYTVSVVMYAVGGYFAFFAV